MFNIDKQSEQILKYTMTGVKSKSSYNKCEMTEAPEDLDYVMEHIVGGIGFWQWTRCFMLIPAYMAMTLPNLLHIFAAFAPDHRCHIPGCDEKDSGFKPSFVDFAIPKDKAGSNFVREVRGLDPCRRHVSHDNVSCVAENFDSNATVGCSSYVYDRHDYTATLTTELDLVCDSEYKRHMLGSVLMLALTIGSLLGGRVVDKIGRRKGIYFGLALTQPLVILGGYIGKQFWLYVLLRIVSCTFMVFAWVGTHSLQLEYFSTKNRRLCHFVTSVLNHTAGLALPLIVDFSSMHLWVGITGCAALPMYFFTTESPRWLACNNRLKEAEAILHDIARGNGRLIHPSEKVKINEVLERVAKESNQTHDTDLSAADLFVKPLRRRSLTLLSCWCLNILTYYVFVLNVDDLSGSLIQNFVLMHITEYPGHITHGLLLDRAGRKRLGIFGFLGTAFSLLLLAVIPKTQATLTLVVFLIGKYLAGVAGVTCWLYTAEVYPTNLRSQACGTFSMASRFVTMSSTFLPLLSRIWGPLPMLLIGIPQLPVAWALTKLPESANRPLPQTFQDAINMDLHELQATGENEYSQVPLEEQPIIIDAEELSTSEDEV